MPRSLLAIILAAGLTCVPAIAQAQTAEGPGVEVGGQVSAQTGQHWAPTYTPRLSLTLAPLTSLEFTADLRPATEYFSSTRMSSQSYGMHVRQSLWSRGRLQVFGVVGAGVERTTSFFPGRIIEGRDGPQVVEASQYSDVGLAVHIGTAAQLEVAPHLALRADVRTTLSEDGGMRAMLGAVVPLGGRFRSDSTRGNLRAGHDSLTNGIAIGAGTGAIIAGAGVGFLVNAFCEQDDCLAATTGAVVVAGVAGAGLGGVVGAVVDSLIIRKEPGGMSAGVALRWR